MFVSIVGSAGVEEKVTGCLRSWRLSGGVRQEAGGGWPGSQDHLEDRLLDPDLQLLLGRGRLGEDSRDQAGEDVDPGGRVKDRNSLDLDLVTAADQS